MNNNEEDLQQEIIASLRLEIEQLKSKLSKAIKARKKYEQKLDDMHEKQLLTVEQKKMASMAQLVAGMAHEANTPIGVCVTSSSVIKRDLVSFKSAYQGGTLDENHIEHFFDMSEDCIVLIEANLQRLAEMMTNFKKLALQQKEVDLEIINMMPFITKMQSYLHQKYCKHEQLISVECGESIQIKSYAQYWQEILEQLTKNAVIHGFKHKHDGQINIYIDSNEDELIVLFSDNGEGMSTETSEQIFTPFFTTLRSSGAMGIGMNHLYNYITHVFKGTISVRSSLNKGCEVIIMVPLAIPIGEDNNEQ